MVPWIAMLPAPLYPAHTKVLLRKDTSTGINVLGCANGSTIQSKVTYCLALSKLPSKARMCHKFVEVNLPLVLVPKLCTHGCIVNFGHNMITGTKDGEHQLINTRDP